MMERRIESEENPDAELVDVEESKEGQLNKSYGGVSVRSISGGSLDHDSVRWMHPPPGDVPFIVNVRIAVKAIKHVSTLNQNFFVRLGIVFYWTDARLVGWLDDDLPSKLWCPKLLCVNREDNFVVAPDCLHLLDAATGRLKRGYNMDGFVSNPLDYLELFPKMLMNSSSSHQMTN